MTDKKRAISLICAESFDAVKQIHATRKLPPLKSLLELRKELDTGEPGVNFQHQLSAYLVRTQDMTLWAVDDSGDLPSKGAVAVLDLPVKVLFVLEEFWVEMGGHATNLRDRVDAAGITYPLDAIPAGE